MISTQWFWAMLVSKERACATAPWAGPAAFPHTPALLERTGGKLWFSGRSVLEINRMGFKENNTQYLLPRITFWALNKISNFEKLVSIAMTLNFLRLLMTLWDTWCECLIWYVMKYVNTWRICIVHSSGGAVLDHIRDPIVSKWPLLAYTITHGEKIQSKCKTDEWI